MIVKRNWTISAKKPLRNQNNNKGGGKTSAFFHFTLYSMSLTKFLMYSILLVVGLSSCTIVTSTNIPGEKLSKIPKELHGEYQLEMPGEMAGLMGENALIVTFKSDRMITNDENGNSENLLGDSLYFSKVGKSIYISLGETPNFTVYKVERKGKDLHLYSLFAESDVTKTQLEPYFSKVEEIPGEPDENGEVSPPSYSVTIDPKRIDSYFKSGLSSKEPYILKRATSKKKK